MRGFVKMLREIADNIESGKYPPPSWNSEIKTKGRKHIVATGYRTVSFQYFDKELEGKQLI